MRRKRVDVLSAVPARLAEYKPAEWGSFEEWKAARTEWADTHGWPGGVLAKLVQEREVRLGGVVFPGRR